MIPSKEVLQDIEAGTAETIRKIEAATKEVKDWQARGPERMADIRKALSEPDRNQSKLPLLVRIKRAIREWIGATGRGVTASVIRTTSDHTMLIAGLRADLQAYQRALITTQAEINELRAEVHCLKQSRTERRNSKSGSRGVSTATGKARRSRT